MIVVIISTVILTLLAMSIVVMALYGAYNTRGGGVTTSFEPTTGTPIKTYGRSLNLIANFRLLRDVPKFMRVSAKPETYYNKLLLDIVGGKMGVRINEGLIVDILTHTHAYEVEFASKNYEGLGQALVYAHYTGKKPGLLILIRDKREHTAFIKIKPALDYYAGMFDMDFRVFKINNRTTGDFIELIDNYEWS